MDVKNTTTQELDQSLKVQTTASESIDEATDKVSRHHSKNWNRNLGYLKNHVSVKAVMNKLKLWTFGEGIEADDRTTKILERITGWGKETAADVFGNQLVIKHVNGDSYGEIVTTDGESISENGDNLQNVKPLNPGRMETLVNASGIIIGYEEMSSDGKKVLNKFDPEEIFHLVLNRTANEIHGTSDIDSIITFLDKIKQLDEDMSIMFHRFVVPLVIWKLNTDDPTAMATFKTQSKNARNGGDDMVISDKAVDWSMLEAGKGVGKIIDPMGWRNKWTEEVIKGGEVPALIMAIESQTTEAASKMVTLAWEKVAENSQRSFEKQVKAQLHLEITLPQSITIEQNLADDEAKDAGAQTKMKPSETTTSLPGTK